jgi:hypothetical protein
VTCVVSCSDERTIAEVFADLFDEDGSEVSDVCID